MTVLTSLLKVFLSVELAEEENLVLKRSLSFVQYGSKKPNLLTETI